MVRTNSTRHWRYLAALLLAASLIAACSAESVPPAPTTPPPKQLATVVIPPTEPATAAPDTPAPTAAPTITSTPRPSTPTATYTPVIGTFMGDGAAPVLLPTAAPFTGGSASGAVLLTPFAGGSPSFVITSTGVSGGVSGDSNCAQSPDPAFALAYQNAQVAAAIGCPTGPALRIESAQQPFQRGVMIWRSTGEIYALAQGAAGSEPLYWRVPDQWDDSVPESDPNLTPPGEGLRQPVRGFGLAWRSSAPVQSALGWATEAEAGFTGVWQSFERGLMLLDANGRVYALVPTVSPAQGRYIGPL